MKAMVLQENNYINLSNELRSELELRIDTLYVQDKFSNYVSAGVGNLREETNVERLCAYITGKCRNGQMISCQLKLGIITWLNMYYTDRLSVIAKFKTYYYNFITPGIRVNAHSLNIVFCKFLVIELLKILAQTKWQPIRTGFNQSLKPV